MFVCNTIEGSSTSHAQTRGRHPRLLGNVDRTGGAAAGFLLQSLLSRSKRRAVPTHFEVLFCLRVERTAGSPVFPEGPCARGKEDEETPRAGRAPVTAGLPSAVVVTVVRRYCARRYGREGCVLDGVREGMGQIVGVGCG